MYVVNRESPLLGSLQGRTSPPNRTSDRPFPWSAYDHVFDAELLDAVRRSFPSPDWSGWVRYDSPGEKKLAANANLPPACQTALDELNQLCPEGCWQDPRLFAAGLNAMPHDGFLDVHLDSSVHPGNQYRRAQNAILFLDDWDESWGGALQFWDVELQSCESVCPAAGRLVRFACNDVSYHGVQRITAPAGVWRRSLCVFWYEPTVVEVQRARAQFVRVAGEPWDAVKDAWRQSRCQADENLTK
jgi:2OG-Fe(II) oxygenase superfamily